MSTKARALGFGVVLLAGGVAYAEHVASSHRAERSAASLSAARARGELVLRVPHLTGAITLDGDMDDQGWTRPPGPASTGEFLLDNGKPARPHTHARLVWGGEYLYMAVLASDEDIRSDDAFDLVFSQGDSEHTMAVTPRAVISGSIEGAHASSEIDGTIDNPKNFDEEWSLELAIPFASLGMKGERGENIGLTLSRCDTPKDGSRVCSAWRGRIVLE